MTNEELADLIRKYEEMREYEVDTCDAIGHVLWLAQELRIFKEGLVGVESDPVILRGLLALVTPHCSGCCRPATKFEGTMYSQEKPTDVKRYTCDEHATAGVKWTDLPGAETIREATRRSM